MKIAVLGAGNGGSAVAADMAYRGHDVTLIKTSNSMHDEHFAYLKANGGRIALLENGRKKSAQLSLVTRDLAALSVCDVVIVYIQTNYHEDLIKRMLPYLRDGQVVLFNPGYLTTAYMLKHGVPETVTIAEAESAFIDCRITAPGEIKAGFRNVINPIGIYPKERLSYAKSRLELLGFPFSYLSSVVEAALHNPNLIVHTVGGIMSIPRIEKTKGAYCMYHEVFTPSVWRILEKLDAEKMDVLESMGFARLSYSEACKIRNSAEPEKDAKQVFMDYAAMETRAIGPVVVDSRYISEDVPQGLVLLESLGQTLKVPTPVCAALIEIASAALGRDLRQEGRTLKGLTQSAVTKILTNGGQNSIA